MRFVFVAAFFQGFQTVDLRRAHGRIIDFQHINRVFIFELEFIDADHGLTTAINGRLGARGGFFNPHFRNTLLNRCRHAAEFFNFLNMAERARRQIMRQFFDKITAAPRVDDFGGVAFHLQHKLSITRNARREIGRQSQCFVKAIGVQRLRMALRRGHRFNTGADNIIVNILRRQAPARGLAMGAECQRFRIFRAKSLHELCPKQARGAHFGNLHKEVFANGPEERQARRESINIQTCRHTGTRIFNAIGQRISQFEVSRRTGFLHVIAGD